ncbi:MAG: hypothetical protein COA73_00860 [Candidatus Hydrogenedentota bacterium]|nr:MAG: hypothetical protein COA73_00860 [Candidatus Hydrogenedentota bacterium]
MPENNYDVSIVIVGLNAKKYVIDCIESIQKAVWRDLTYEVIYVDNGSTDGSAGAVRDHYADSVVLLENDTNVGYCPAANQGARIGNGRYLYFINDDTIVIDDAIALTVEYMDEHPETGTAGSRLIYPDGSEQYSGRRFPGFVNAIFGRRSFLTKLFPGFKSVKDYLYVENLKEDSPFEVDWVSAAGQCVRKEDFFSIGGYAEDYYYWHEAVFCHRLIEQGKNIILHPCSKVIHYEGQGSGPRPVKAQRFHIINFHKGAFRAFREWHGLSLFNPLLLVIGAALCTRASFLFIAAHARAALPSGQGSS